MGRSARGRLRSDDRAVSPVVGKAVEAGVVVLYVVLVTATLYGGVVPTYRTAAGRAVGERVLAQSAERVQQAVPADARSVSVNASVSLPRTIRGRPYAIRARNRTLVLDHPDERVSGNVTLALPATVTSVRGNWSSTDSAVVAVRDGPDGLVVTLESAVTADAGNGGGSA